MAVLESLLLVAVLAVCARLLLAAARFRRLELAIAGPASLPLLGNLPQTLGLTPDNALATFLRLWNGQHRELWRLSLFGHLAVFANDPDHLQELFARKDLLDKDPFAYRFFASIGHGIFLLNGAEWRAHRRAVQPAFRQSVLDRYTAIFSTEALGFVRRVRPGAAQDTADNLHNLTARAFLWTAITWEKGEEEVEQVLPHAKEWMNSISHSYSHRIVQPWLWPDWAFYSLTHAGRSIRRMTNKIEAFCTRAIAARRAQLKQQREDAVCDDAPSSKHRTLLDILLEPGDRLSLSDDEILGELKTFIAVSIDTTVATLGWVLKVLSLRQGVQERLLQEVEEVLGKDVTSHIIGTKELDRLQYTERVLKESMRLLPSVPLMARLVKEETDFCGRTLPAGSTVVGNILAAHRDPRHWPDPLRFDPDRFLPENSEGRHPYAYLPFSAGPKNCPGGRYAMMLMKTLLATLVPRYCIDAVDDGYKEPADLPMSLGITSRMTGGARVVFTPRQSADCAA